MLPVAAPFCAEDWYKMVMMGGSNEEETHDHQKDTTKKLGEKDLFYYELYTLELSELKESMMSFCYTWYSEPVVFDVIAPPPEHIV